MDEMKIGSKFTTGILSKLIAMLIRKKFGYDVELKLNEVNATVIFSSYANGPNPIVLDRSKPYIEFFPE